MRPRQQNKTLAKVSEGRGKCVQNIDSRGKIIQIRSRDQQVDMRQLECIAGSDQLAESAGSDPEIF